MCAHGRARDSVIRGAREQTSVAPVAMATLQQSNRLQIASCISFPSPSPRHLSLHGLLASLGPLHSFCYFFIYKWLPPGCGSFLQVFEVLHRGEGRRPVRHSGCNCILANCHASFHDHLSIAVHHILDSLRRFRQQEVALVPAQERSARQVVFPYQADKKHHHSFKAFY